MGDLLDYVGATQQRSEQPRITCVPMGTCLAGRPYKAPFTAYGEPGSLLISARAKADNSSLLVASLPKLVEGRLLV
jgi:hypothetical protein